MSNCKYLDQNQRNPIKVRKRKNVFIVQYLLQFKVWQNYCITKNTVRKKVSYLICNQCQTVGLVIIGNQKRLTIGHCQAVST